MLKQERLNSIEGFVNEHKFASLHQLMELTSSSESTIRADIIELSEQGKVRRLRGGVSSLIAETSAAFELSMEEKYELQRDEKMAIARYAATLVKPRTIVYLDAGTSTYYLADVLETPDVEFMTNSYIVAQKLSKKGYKVYMTGGEFKPVTDAFIGTFTGEMLSKFAFDLGFFGTNGIDKEKGLTTPDFEEAMIKKMAMGQCKKLFVLADHTKFGVVTAVGFHPFKGEEIITDRIPRDFLDQGIKEA